MEDSNLINAEGHAMYYTYDDLDRPIIEGVCVPIHSIDYIRGALSEGYSITSLLADSFPTTTTEYYSNESSGIPSDLAFKEVSNVVSSDNVDSTRCITFPSYELVMEVPYFAKRTYPDGKSGTRLVIPHQYIRRAYWYDKKGRMIQKVEKSSDGWTSRYSTKYDFVGNSIATMEAHTSQFGDTDSLLTINTYDKRGRLTSYTRTLNGHVFSPVYYSYDFAGRIKNKQVGETLSNGTANLLETYSRDIRGWLTNISANTYTVGQVFSESLEYMSPTLSTSPLFNGNISMMTMDSYNQKTVMNTYNYDHLGRLLGNRRYVDGTTTTIGTESGIIYDLNGNINRLTRHDGSSRYTMWMNHIGNRISGGETDFGNSDGEMAALNFSYDLNGNIISMCQADSIQYNILNLPRRSEGTIFTYYSDGTKESTFYSTGGGLKYRGNFIYKDNGGGIGSLESVAYPDGRILRSPQIPIGDADCWQVKDHLGNVRVLHCLNSGGYMPVFEVNDYLPFGGRIQNASQPAFSLNRYRYAGKEEHDNFVVCDNLNNLSLTANDFGARFLTPFLGSWTSPDPIAAIASSKTPYGYCSSNPINKVDKTGEWDATVHLYKDRKEYGYGIAIVTTNSGNEIYRFNVRAEGVKGHNRHITGADTPLGTYDIPNSSPWISGGSRASYGPNPRLSMIGIQGEIVDTKRNSIRIHGGRQEVYNNRSKQWDKINSPKLKKTFGCLRAFDEDIKEFKVITDNLMSNDSNEYPGQVLIIDDLEKVINSSGKNFVEIVIDYQIAPKYIDWKNIWLNFKNTLK